MMVNLKNLKKLAMAAALTAVGLLGSQAASEAALGNVYISSLGRQCVDFDEATFTFDSNGHTEVKYSFDKGKSWIFIKGLPTTDTKVIIDISSLSPSKDASVMVQGCDTDAIANVTSASTMNFLKEKKLSNLKLEYNALTGQVTFKEAPEAYYEYRVATTARWALASGGHLRKGSSFTNTPIERLQARGGTVFVRKEADNYDQLFKIVVTNAAITRASKPASVKVAAQAKAPALKINYLTGKATFPKNVELTIRSGRTKTYYTSLTDPKQTAQTLTWVSSGALTTITSLDLMPYLVESGANGLTVEARIPATETKKESLVAEVSLDPVIEAPKEAADVKFNYLTETFETVSSAAYEYVLSVSDAAVKTPGASDKWTVIKFKEGQAVNITSKITNIPANKVGTLFVRKVGTKANIKAGTVNKLPSHWVTYEIDPRPTFATLAAIDYLAETVTVGAMNAGSKVQYSRSGKFDTLTSVTADKTVTMAAFGVNLNDTKYSKTTFYYRIEPTTGSTVTTNPAATNYTGTVASLSQKIAIPARPAAPKATYNAATQMFTLTVGKAFDWKTESTSNQALTYREVTDKLFAHPSTDESVYVFQWTPAVTSGKSLQFASHVYRTPLATKADKKITVVSGSALEAGTSLFVSGASIAAGQSVEITGVPNVTGKLKYSKTIKPVNNTTTTQVTVTLIPNAGYRFSCTTSALAKALFAMDANSKNKVTSVSNAVYKAPTASTQGQIVFTLIIQSLDNPTS